MATKADFYVGDGASAVWIGSIAGNGTPNCIPGRLLASPFAATWKKYAEKFISEHKSGRLPKDGWPWEHNTSACTDYVYSFVDNEVKVAVLGLGWMNPFNDLHKENCAVLTFPNMSNLRIAPPPQFIEHWPHPGWYWMGSDESDERRIVQVAPKVWWEGTAFTTREDAERQHTGLWFYGPLIAPDRK
jgi:hypothetical protein